MGVRLSPSSVEIFSCRYGASSFDSGSVGDQIQCVEVALARTESVFAVEGDFLRPQSYSAPVGFEGGQSCVGHELHGDPDCHLNLLVQELMGCPCLDEGAPVASSKGHSAIVLLGVISIGAVTRLIEQEDPKLICCLFRKDEEWVSWVCSNEIEAIQKLLIQRKIVLRALPSRSMKTDLFSLLRDELFGFVGSALLVANVADPAMAVLVKSFRSSFLNGLRGKSGGPCVDEFMMMFHTDVNYRLKNFDLIASPSVPVCRPLVVVGSGPSLDASLADLRLLREHCFVMSAGSSLGTLLRSGIRPHFHVHVERGYSGELKGLYQTLLDECGLDDFGDTIAVLPTSIDPELPSLYKRVLMYGRSAQTPVLAWAGLKTALLRHEGPECLSAAFAFAMHLRPQRVFLLGCDLGSVAGSADRSVGALGRSSRDFPLRVPGNLGRFVMTSSQMLLQLSYMQAACSAASSAPEVFNLSNGIRLPFAKPLTSVHLPKLPPMNESVDSSLDALMAAISAPGIGPCSPPFGESEIASAKQWIDQWLELAQRAPTLPSFAVRLQASRLLSSRNYAHCELVYRLFRGSFRDGFWLTAFAVDHYCQSINDKQHCWGSFSRFLKALSLEVDAIPSWLGSGDKVMAD